MSWPAAAAAASAASARISAMAWASARAMRSCAMRARRSIRAWSCASDSLAKRSASSLAWVRMVCASACAWLARSVYRTSTASASSRSFLACVSSFWIAVARASSIWPIIAGTRRHRISATTMARPRPSQKSVSVTSSLIQSTSRLLRRADGGFGFRVGDALAGQPRDDLDGGILRRARDMRLGLGADAGQPRLRVGGRALGIGVGLRFGLLDVFRRALAVLIVDRARALAGLEERGLVGDGGGFRLAAVLLRDLDLFLDRAAALFDGDFDARAGEAPEHDEQERHRHHEPEDLARERFRLERREAGAGRRFCPGRGGAFGHHAYFA